MTPERRRPRVVIAGGGVGGLEAALAVRELAGERVSIELIAPQPRVVYRALSVAEPFGYARAMSLPLARLRRSHGVELWRDSLAAVRPDVREIELSSSTTVPYDALILALGARQEGWLQGSVTFTGPDAVPRVREVLDGIAAGTVESVCFAAPSESWTLPLYELALLTASWCAEHHMSVALSVVTPEAVPLSIFGQAAAKLVTGLLADRGIRLLVGVHAQGFDGRRVRLSSGEALDVEAVVTLPRLLRTPVPGVPANADGFVAVDEHARVPGCDGVYAVGDLTDQPVKQGGLAAQQADAAAASIARRFGAMVELQPFRPVLRGLLLTGVASAYLRHGEEDMQATFDALWWPPSKIAGRYLGPYLAEQHRVGAMETLVDRPSASDPERAARDRADVRGIAVELAHAEARWGDHDAALHWLATVERLDGVLTQELEDLRERCQGAR